VKGKRFRCAGLPQEKPETGQDSAPWYCPNCRHDEAAQIKQEIADEDVEDALLNRYFAA